MMDADALDKDTGLEELPETFVIFITPGDAIGGGKPLYRIERTVEETGRRFGDGSHIVYVSSSLAERDTRLGMLMHDLACADPREMHYRELRDRVSYFKETKEGITDMENEFDRVLKNVRKGRCRSSSGHGRRPSGPCSSHTSCCCGPYALCTAGCECVGIPPGPRQESL